LHPGTFYFVTTGATTIPISATVPDNDSGRLYRLVLDAADPSAPATIEMVWQGGPDTGVSYDNITVNHHGEVIIQEDRTAAGITIMAQQQRYARVLQYNIATDSATFLFEANQAAITPEFASDYGNWETSGIIEVEPEAFDGRSSYLLSVQAHTIPDVRYLQGGQILLTVPVVPEAYIPAIQTAANE
ncbi:MAG: hypothetical protein KDE51_16915, partial [Anaerolineales bacterium]|nr:hypothetical protein [Anaerolineales bacterium]